MYHPKRGVIIRMRPLGTVQSNKNHVHDRKYIAVLYQCICFSVPLIYEGVMEYKALSQYY